MNKSYSLSIYNYLEQPHINGSLTSELAFLDDQEMEYFWSEKSWGDYLRINRYFLLTIKDELKLVGSLVGRIATDFTFFELDKIFVHNEYSRKGLGTYLLKSLEKELKAKSNPEKCSCIYLEVSSKNPSAISFYENSGFSTYHIVKKYYSDGSGAVKMRKSLPYT